jgi:predicted metalloprotease with PDZ domain
MTQPLQYRISASRAEAHIFELELTIAKPDPSGQHLSMPNWIPGSYMIRDFSRNIVSLRAESATGEAVAVHKLGKASWRCDPVSGPLILRYEVYAWDLSVRAAHLDCSHGYFNGSSVFLAVAGQEDQPHALDIVAPACAEGWEVATSLPRQGAAEWGFGQYGAASYDELIDHPVEMGRFTRARFMACGVPHDVVITGQHRADMDRLCRDLSKICEAEIRFFGEPAPFERYVFLVTAVGNGYGGLEHRASTSLLCAREDLPLATEPVASPGERYKTFLGLCSHEYFHSWNVKRIKPQVFIPYDLRAETHTGLLWAFEGITSYYDDLFLARAGLISSPAYLELLAQQITRHLRSGGRLVQSVVDSSFDAWTKYYKQDENSPNAVVSYYVKGALVALCLDLTLRQRSGGRVSLDNVMVRLWHEFGEPGNGVGDNDIQALCEAVLGESLADFFSAALHGTGELPFAGLLRAQGIDVLIRPAESSADNGGKAVPVDPARQRPVLGARIAPSEGGAQLAQVFSGGPAMQAGLSAGDVVIAVDGLKVNAITAEKLISSYAVGATIPLHAFRRDELMRFEVTLGPAPADTCVLTLPAEVDTARRAERWILGR